VRALLLGLPLKDVPLDLPKNRALVATVEALDHRVRWSL
jgi:hypothetical protein